MQSKLEEYLYYNGEEIAARTMAMSEIKRTPAENVRSAPTEFDSNTEDGVYSITENGEEFAIHKKGSTFRLYSYATGDVSKPMTAGELNGHLEKAKAQKSDSGRNALSGDSAIEIEADPELSERLKNATKSKYTVIKEYLVEKFYGEKFTLSDGVEATMDKSDAQHISSTDPLSVAELSNLRKIIEKAEFSHGADNVEHDKFDAFRYYSFKVKFNGEVFEMLLNVGRSKYDQTYHIYDITKNGRTAGQASPGLGRPGGYALRNDSSNNSIPQPPQNSNTFDENISEDATNLSENENSAEKVGAETEDRAENVREEAKDAAENVTEPAENVAEATEDKYSAIGIGIWARENVSGYGELSEPAKRIVRDTIRQARALGKADSDIKLIATVAARSGLNIVYDASIEGDGLYQGNTIYVNPELSIERTCEVLLGHEMFHKLFASGGKKAMSLFTKARELIGADEAEEVRSKYREHYAKKKELNRVISNDITPELKNSLTTEETAILEKEVAAHGAEKVFESPDAWEYILSEEPSFKEKVLGFFGQAARKYSSEEKLAAQSRKFLREYRKLFKELEARNRGNNALSRALETTPGIEKTVTSMNDENMQVTDKRFALKESAYKIELSNDFVNKILEHYKITKPSDYIHVQKQVITTLADNNFFTDNENRRLTEINEATGMVVELNKSGIYETFNLNNYGRLGINKKIAKLAVLQQVPDAIKKGRVIADDVENVHYDGGNKKFAYIEYDTELDGREISVKLVIKKSSQKNKFWVHSVYTSENASGSSASTKNSAEAGHITADISNSIPQNQKKSTLSGEKISNGRHALPKTDKNAAKKGTPTVADSDKIEVSRGKLEQMRANYKGDKVFYKKDVVAALKGIDALVKLPADMREDIRTY